MKNTEVEKIHYWSALVGQLGRSKNSRSQFEHQVGQFEHQVGQLSIKSANLSFKWADLGLKSEEASQRQIRALFQVDVLNQLPMSY